MEWASGLRAPRVRISLVHRCFSLGILCPDHTIPGGPTPGLATLGKDTVRKALPDLCAESGESRRRVSSRRGHLSQSSGKVSCLQRQASEVERCLEILADLAEDFPELALGAVLPAHHEPKPTHPEMEAGPEGPVGGSEEL